jgi:hypothetical protein
MSEPSKVSSGNETKKHVTEAESNAAAKKISEKTMSEVTPKANRGKVPGQNLCLNLTKFGFILIIAGVFTMMIAEYTGMDYNLMKMISIIASVVGALILPVSLIMFVSMTGRQNKMIMEEIREIKASASLNKEAGMEIKKI